MDVIRYRHQAPPGVVFTLEDAAEMIGKRPQMVTTSVSTDGVAEERRPLVVQAALIEDDGAAMVLFMEEA